MRKLLPLLTVTLMFTGLQKTNAQTLEPHWWQTNGVVKSIVKDTVNNIVYLGGNFTSIAPPVNFGTQLDLANGAQTPNFSEPNDIVRISLPDGSGGWFIGGDFTMVGNNIHQFITHINSSKQITN